LRIYKGHGLNDHQGSELETKLAKAQQKAVLQIHQVGNHQFKLESNPHLDLPEFDNVFQAIYWSVSLLLPSKEKLEQFQKTVTAGCLNNSLKSQSWLIHREISLRPVKMKLTGCMRKQK